MSKKDASPSYSELLITPGQVDSGYNEPTTTYGYGSDPHSSYLPEKQPQQPPSYSNNIPLSMSNQPQHNPTYLNSAQPTPIVDLETHSGLKSTLVSREVLNFAKSIPYTPTTFKSDNNKQENGNDYAYACAGPMGIVVLIFWIILVGESMWGRQRHNSNFQFLLAVFVIGIGLIAVYCVTFVKPSCKAAMGCNDRSDEINSAMALDANYLEATWNRGKSNPDAIPKSIKTLSQDTPQVRFHIVCSERDMSDIHSTTLDHRHNGIKYQATFTLPICHYRWVGTTPAQFLSVVDFHHSGDAVVNYVPDVITVPEQSDFIRKFALKLKARFQSKAKHCHIFTRIVCGQRNDYNHQWSEPPLEHDFGEADDENQSRNGRQATPTVYMATSLGRKIDFYQSSGRTADCCLKLATSRLFWCVNTMLCTMICMLPFLHARWAHAKYHSSFHIIFPDWDLIDLAFDADPNAFQSIPQRIIGKDVIGDAI